MLQRGILFFVIILDAAAMELFITKIPVACSDPHAIKEILVHNKTQDSLNVVVTFNYLAHIIPFKLFGPSSIHDELGYIQLSTDPILARSDEWVTVKAKIQKQWRETWNETHVAGVATINGIKVHKQKKMYTINADDGQIIVK